MNERIQELAEQAIANVRFWKGCNQESYGVDEHELAKFAELIVKECMLCVDACESEMFYDDGMVPIIDVNDRIKKHFGLEE